MAYIFHVMMEQQKTDAFSATHCSQSIGLYHCSRKVESWGINGSSIPRRTVQRVRQQLCLRT